MFDYKKPSECRNGWQVKNLRSNGKVILGKFYNPQTRGWYPGCWTLTGRESITFQRGFDLVNKEVGQK